MKKLIPFLVLALFVTGCTLAYTPKEVRFHKDSINLHPMTVLIQDSENDAEQPQIILPDGSYVSLPNGTAGNLLLFVTLNDGTEQESRGSASAAATVQSPGSTTGSTTADEGATGTTTTTGGEGSGEPVEDPPE